MVKHGQSLGSGEPIAFSLPKIDFALWAKSMGIEAFTIQSSQDLEQCDFEHFAQSSGPVILDVMVDPEEVPPIQNRIQALIQSSS